MSFGVHAYSPTASPLALVPCSKLSVDVFRGLHLLDSLQGREHSLLSLFPAWYRCQEPNRVPDSQECIAARGMEDGIVSSLPAWLLRDLRGTADSTIHAYTLTLIHTHTLNQQYYPHPPHS